MNRLLQPELLDHLPADDPQAIHSRRDLRRINALMGNARTLSAFIALSESKGRARCPQRAAPKPNALEHPRSAEDSGPYPFTLVELGAGDGNIALQVARSISSTGRIILVDKEPTTPIEKIEGWTIETVRADVFAWLESAPNVDVIIANLFLHHFETEPLRSLLAQSAQRCRVFAAAEPRRNKFAQLFASLVGLIGCNDVTRHDAVISVRAGFNADELTALWPATGWTATEKRAGRFTHFFGAVRS